MILTYHRVLPAQEVAERWVQPGMYVEVEVFAQHMRFLREQFHVLSFQELLNRWDRKEWDQQERYCVVTFDDGWLDNYRYAYPILKELELPATIFLPTDFVGGSEWFWPEKLSYLVNGMSQTPVACAHGAAVLSERLRLDIDGVKAACQSHHASRDLPDRIIECAKALHPSSIDQLITDLQHKLGITIPCERVIMNWEEVGTMSQNRISFGSHSCSHRILTQLQEDEIKAELEESQHVLRARNSNFVPVFCYPNGNNNEKIRTLVRACGYKAATGVRSGVESSSPVDQFELRRIGIHNDIASTIPLYTLRLLGTLAA